MPTGDDRLEIVIIDEGGIQPAGSQPGPQQPAPQATPPVPPQPARPPAPPSVVSSARSSEVPEKPRWEEKDLKKQRAEIIGYEKDIANARSSQERADLRAEAKLLAERRRRWDEEDRRDKERLRAVDQAYNIRVKYETKLAELQAAADRARRNEQRDLQRKIERDAAKNYEDSLKALEFLRREREEAARQDKAFADKLAEIEKQASVRSQAKAASDAAKKYRQDASFRERQQKLLRSEQAKMRATAAQRRLTPGSMTFNKKAYARQLIQNQVNARIRRKHINQAMSLAKQQRPLLFKQQQAGGTVGGRTIQSSLAYAGINIPGIGGLTASLGPVGGAAVAATGGLLLASHVLKKLNETVMEAASAISSFARNDNIGGLFKTIGIAQKAVEAIPVIGGILSTMMETQIVIFKAMHMVTQAFVERGKQLAMYSGPLTQATATAEIRSLMADIREAQVLGPKLAKLIDIESRMSSDFREILLPLKMYILDKLNGYLEKVAPKVEYIPDALELMNAKLQGMLQIFAVLSSGNWGLALDLIKNFDKRMAEILLGISKKHLDDAEERRKKDISINDLFGQVFNPDSYPGQPADPFKGPAPKWASSNNLNVPALRMP